MASASQARLKQDQSMLTGGSLPGTAPTVKQDSKDANITGTNKTKLVEISLGFEKSSIEPKEVMKDPQ